MKRKILYLIDDKRLAGVVAKELRLLRCEISEGQGEIMEKIFDLMPHLVVIDQAYAGGQGLKIAQSLKQDMVLRHIPVLLITDDVVPEPLSSEEKIDACIPKSKNSKVLLQKARFLLQENQIELDLNPLTSLPGTRTSVLRIEKAIRSKAPFTVCCLDLENLAVFNSAYGDARGDEVIVRLSRIIEEALNYHGAKGDFIGHLGGDDLIILVKPEHSEAIAETIIQNFDAAIPSFYNPQDREQGYLVHQNKDGVLAQVPIMSVSIAILHNEGSSRYKLPQISKIAGDLKKYMKALPGSCYIQYRRTPKGSGPRMGQGLEVRFPSKMKSVNITEFKEDVDAHTAFFKSLIKTKNIRSVYQPIVDLKSKRIMGYEALTRALSDAPNQDVAFLFSAARDAGMVKELDEICVECALKSAQGIGSEKKLFLNLNQETLLDSKIMKRLFSGKGTLDYKNIVIEVTEQSILRAFHRMRDALLELKEKGVAVAIDDVGGGAVSLRDVALLRPDYIKFDRSLVRQIDISATKQQIVASMITFAKGIRAISTAEGIETREELEAVIRCGAVLGQGYFFAKPGPPFPKLSI